MKNKAVDVQCPTCHAPLKFNAKVGKMKCEYCGNEFNVEDLKDEVNVNVEESTEEVQTELVTYKCSDCGATIVCDDQTSATFCLYCGNTAILKDKLVGKFQPDLIIPFKVDKEDAQKAFIEMTKKKPFVPKEFVSTKNIEKITGLYVPFWLYEFNVDGEVDADGVRITNWTSGDRYYTKKDFYKLIRSGSMTYKRVPVDGSTRFANDMMNSIEPFYYHYLTKFHPGYLSGYLAEKYDIEANDCEDEAKKRSLNSAQDIMVNDMGNYSSKVVVYNTLSAKKKKVEYALLPVWMVNVKYKDNYYLFAMNGQTGEFVGNVPIDKKKMYSKFIQVFVIAFIIVMVISYIAFLLGGNA